MDPKWADHSADSQEWVTAQPIEFNQCVGLPASRKWGQTTFQGGILVDMKFKVSRLNCKRLSFLFVPILSLLQLTKCLLFTYQTCEDDCLRSQPCLQDLSPRALRSVPSTWWTGPLMGAARGPQVPSCSCDSLLPRTNQPWVTSRCRVNLGCLFQLEDIKRPSLTICENNWKWSLAIEFHGVRLTLWISGF